MTIIKSKAAKAYVAGAIAALAFAVPGVDDGFTLSEALGAVAAFLVGFQGVYWTTNEDSDA